MSPNTYKALAVGAVLGFLFSVGPSCGSSSTGTTCGPSNCATGCCNAGKCVTGTNGNNTTCGTQGNACVDCTKTTGASCSSAFKCTTGSTGGGTGGSGGGATGGGTGGATGGGTGGAGGGMASCQATCTGCCDASGVCQTGTAATACGMGGATCSACTGTATCTNNACKDPNCTTCTKNGVCQTTGMLGNTVCGSGGNVCLDCTTTAGATCNTTTGVCSGGTCAGCRDTTSACVAGNTKGACGLGGGSCTACTGTNVCSNGQCVPPGTGGGAGGGGGSAGGGTGGTGGTGTCPGGAPCSNGCCSGSQCIATTFQSATNCGTNGATCAACSSGQLCNVGVCSGAGGGTGGAGGAAGGGAGGGSAAGVIGSACNLDTDCSGVAVTAAEMGQGYKAFCKKTLNPNGAPYPGGYCTRRCIANTACGANGLCDYIDGPFGEIDNICLGACSQAAPCRANYGCYNYGTQATPNNRCFPQFLDGGDIGPFDPGPGNSANVAAGPCTDDTMCLPQTPPPALGFCFPPTTADGGPSGFPLGECSAECNTSLSDAWCGTNGACNGFIGATTTTGPAVVFICQQECTFGDAGVRSACRTGYTCNGPTNGVCVPRCDNPGAGCTAPMTCNATTGLCQ